MGASSSCVAPPPHIPPQSLKGQQRMCSISEPMHTLQNKAGPELHFVKNLIKIPPPSIVPGPNLVNALSLEAREVNISKKKKKRGNHAHSLSIAYLLQINFRQIQLIYIFRYLMIFNKDLATNILNGLIFWYLYDLTMHLLVRKVSNAFLVTTIRKNIRFSKGHENLKKSDFLLKLKGKVNNISRDSTKINR